MDRIPARWDQRKGDQCKVEHRRRGPVRREGHSRPTGVPPGNCRMPSKPAASGDPGTTGESPSVPLVLAPPSFGSCKDNGSRLSGRGPESSPHLAKCIWAFPACHMASSQVKSLRNGPFWPFLHAEVRQADSHMDPYATTCAPMHGYALPHMVHTAHAYGRPEGYPWDGHRLPMLGPGGDPCCPNSTGCQMGDCLARPVLLGGDWGG